MQSFIVFDKNIKLKKETGNSGPN